LKAIGTKPKMSTMSSFITVRLAQGMIELLAIKKRCQVGVKKGPLSINAV
jgi:hypothetical protein